MDAPVTDRRMESRDLKAYNHWIPLDTCGDDKKTLEISVTSAPLWQSFCF